MAATPTTSGPCGQTPSCLVIQTTAPDGVALTSNRSSSTLARIDLKKDNKPLTIKPAVAKKNADGSFTVVSIGSEITFPVTAGEHSATIDPPLTIAYGEYPAIFYPNGGPGAAENAYMAKYEPGNGYGITYFTNVTGPGNYSRNFMLGADPVARPSAALAGYQFFIRFFIPSQKDGQEIPTGPPTPPDDGDEDPPDSTPDPTPDPVPGKYDLALGLSSRVVGDGTMRVVEAFDADHPSAKNPDPELPFLFPTDFFDVTKAGKPERLASFGNLGWAVEVANLEAATMSSPITTLGFATSPAKFLGREELFTKNKASDFCGSLGIPVLAPGRNSGKICFGKARADYVAKLGYGAYDATFSVPCDGSNELDCTNNQLTINYRLIRGPDSKITNAGFEKEQEFERRNLNPPRSALDVLGQGLRGDFSARAARGAGDFDVRVGKVQVAVARKTRRAKPFKGASAAGGGAPKCDWVKNKRSKFKKSACDKPVWLAATGTGSWQFSLPRGLPEGDYVLYSRAVSKDGASEKNFSAKDKNRREITAR